MADLNEMTRRGFARREWRELARLVLESLAAGMFVSLLLALAVFVASAQAQAAVPGESSRGHGTLMLQDASGNQETAPLARCYSRWQSPGCADRRCALVALAGSKANARCINSLPIGEDPSAGTGP